MTWFVSDDEPRPTACESPLPGTHTSNFPAILEQLDISLAVTTYQAGKVVFLRADGGTIKTRVHTLNKPMGLAVGQGRLAIGTAFEVCDFRNMPATTTELDPSAEHDAHYGAVEQGVGPFSQESLSPCSTGCYIPRAVHLTGDIQVHEMAFVRRKRSEDRDQPPEDRTRDALQTSGLGPPASDELWFVNTRFSCLATHDPEHRFVPTWRPSFVSELTPDDRCHLNGLAVVDGRPKWVTALGATDTSGGWRDNKKNGGILIDVDSSEIVASGLSMPHSPRSHNGRLWLLESGTGSLGYVDVATGQYEPIIRLDGFTRGLDFAGDFAFIGLSQVRESATFSGIEITERLQATERTCGIWVIDLVRGEPIAFLKFDDEVREIFAVCVLPGTRSPELINDHATLVSKRG